MKNEVIEFEKALEFTKIKVRGFKPEKSRPIYLNGGSYTLEKFLDLFRKALGKEIRNYPALHDIVLDEDAVRFIGVIEQWAEEKFAGEGDNDNEYKVPESLSHLTLNVDTSSKESTAKKLFCTTKEELRETEVSGAYYVEMCNLSLSDGIRVARPVIPIYAPRSKRGINTRTNPETKSVHNYFNDYIPAAWELWRERNPKAWKKLPSTPPKEVIKFLKHLVPKKKEREYLYAWIYTSLTTRAFVYLVLQGAPGVGKNRLRYILSALHGANNNSAGKKETLGANGSRFNGQMSQNTLLWFDELKYDHNMEPQMKEYQNSTISIERKGVDATDRSEIYSSMVISNNYPRDNYLLFNSRKFAPLVLGDRALTFSMSPKEIGLMTDLTDIAGKSFDVKYVAQIAKWILKVGVKYVDSFPNLEYQGPKYWELAHTSMSRWQKIAVLALTVENDQGPFDGWDESKKAFQWSVVEKALRRKKEYESKDYRDATTIKAFFDTYRDIKGNVVFETESFEGSIVQDFWVKPVNGLKHTHGNISLNEDGAAESPTTAFKRKPGMTDFEYRKAKKEFEMSTTSPKETKKGKSSNGKKAIDYL